MTQTHEGFANALAADIREATDETVGKPALRSSIFDQAVGYANGRPAGHIWGMNTAPDLDHEMRKLEGRLPNLAARPLRWLRDPSARWLRIPIGTLLIPGGLIGFLPILGFWMVPVGLALISYDIPFLRRPMAKLTARWCRRSCSTKNLERDDERR